MFFLPADSVSVVTQEKKASTIYFLIPVAFTAFVMFLIMTCCCCVTLKHNRDKKTALYKQHMSVPVIQLHGMSGNRSLRMPGVVRNPISRMTESYEEGEIEDERRLKHFERIFSVSTHDVLEMMK